MDDFGHKAASRLKKAQIRKVKENIKKGLKCRSRYDRIATMRFTPRSGVRGTRRMTEDTRQADELRDGARPWSEKKRQSVALAEIYGAGLHEERKALRVGGCAQHLGFAILPDGSKKLISADFCRVRLCPMCMWRRSMKIYGQAANICSHLAKSAEYRYIFCTFAVKNVRGDELSGALDGMLAAWQRLTQRSQIRAAWKGGMRTLEITHNLTDDTYHPHFHAFVAVRPSYFKGGAYISQEVYARLWREAARLDYEPIVDCRTCKGGNEAALAEACKYAAKGTDYIIPDDWELRVQSVRCLDSALFNRRLCAWWGCMAAARKALHLDDAEDGDLISDGSGEENLDAAPRIYYRWLSAYNQYYSE